MMLAGYPKFLGEHVKQCLTIHIKSKLALLPKLTRWSRNSYVNAKHLYNSQNNTGATPPKKKKKNKVGGFTSQTQNGSMECNLICRKINPSYISTQLTLNRIPK